MYLRFAFSLRITRRIKIRQWFSQQPHALSAEIAMLLVHGEFRDAKSEVDLQIMDWIYSVRLLQQKKRIFNGTAKVCLVLGYRLILGK